MGLFEQFPYTNFHEMNLDWVVRITKQLIQEYTQLNQNVTDLTQAYKEIKAYVEEVLSDDGLRQYIETTLDRMLADGELENILAGLVVAYTNVRQLGIIPDSGDVTEQLISAFNNYDMLYFPPGTYTISNTLTLHSGMKILGAGAIINNTAASRSGIHTIVGVNVNNIEINGLCITGGDNGIIINGYQRYEDNRDEDTYNYNVAIKNLRLTTGRFAIHIANVTNFIIDNVQILNDPDSLNTDGVHITSCTHGTVSNVNGVTGDDFLVVMCSEATETGYQTFGTAGNITFNNCSCTNSHRGFSTISVDTDILSINLKDCDFQVTTNGAIESRTLSGQTASYRLYINIDNCTCTSSTTSTTLINMQTNSINAVFNNCQFSHANDNPLLSFANGRLKMINCEFGNNNNDSAFTINLVGTNTAKFIGCWFNQRRYSRISNTDTVWFIGCNLNTNASSYFLSAINTNKKIKFVSCNTNKSLVSLDGVVNNIYVTDTEGGQYIVVGSVQKSVCNVYGNSSMGVCGSNLVDAVVPRSFTLLMAFNPSTPVANTQYTYRSGTIQQIKLVSEGTLKTVQTD